MLVLFLSFIKQCDNASIKTETSEIELPEKGACFVHQQEHGKERNGKKLKIHDIHKAMFKEEM